MRVLITGGAGNLGSAISNHLAAAGAQVLVLDNFATGHQSWISPAAGIEVRETSVIDTNDVRIAFSDFLPTHVIHAAASYADPDDWEGDLSTNALGTLNVVRASEDFAVRSLIYLQTALGYGPPKEIPIPVDHRLNPNTSYAISKVAGEHYALSSKTPTAISLRLANICSPRLAVGPIPTFFKRILEDKVCHVTEAERDFLLVDDFLGLIERLLQLASPERGAFNVSSGEGVTIAQVLDAVASCMGVQSPLRHLKPIGSDDVKSLILDPALTIETFGWKAQTSFSELIEQQVRWFTEYGVGTIRSHLKNLDIQGDVIDE